MKSHLPNPVDEEVSERERFGIRSEARLPNGPGLLAALGVTDSDLGTTSPRARGFVIWNTPYRVESGISLEVVA